MTGKKKAKHLAGLSWLPKESISGVIMNYQSEFVNVLRGALLDIHHVEPNGLLHRVPVIGDKHGRTSGAYVGFSDNIPSLWWQNFKTGDTGTWSAKAFNTMTQAERQQHKVRIEQTRKQREIETAQRYAEAAAKAARIWADSIQAIIHQYLSLKGVKAYGVRTYKESLVIPLRDGAGRLHSLQFIDGKGNKRFLSGGRVKGCYHAIGSASDLQTGTICISEGYASGTSVYMATGYPVAVAFNAGNMPEVAKVLRSKYPAHEIIVCADNDPVGITKANLAALAVGGLVAIPSNERRA